MKTDLQEFLQSKGTIIDVRSPSEYAKGHIPSAHSLPLFSDLERAAIGTVYKQQGERQAIQLGLQYIGPKLHLFTDKIKDLTHPIKIHCWRGGKRSEAMAWLLQFSGSSTLLLTGGYKTYRKWVIEILTASYSIHVIGGMTGSGKTHFLKELQSKGEQTLDLEKLANHRGSAFGMIGKDGQPTQEQFENDLAEVLSKYDLKKTVWIEDESRMIGCCHTPDILYDQMKKAPICIIEKTLEERVKVLLKEYGNCKKTELCLAVIRIQKKLGGTRTKQIIEMIEAGKLEIAVTLILEYYDATYTYSLERRKISSIVID